MSPHHIFGSAYDFIIVGAGTTGLVLANRLSENPSVTVAVIEPGTDQSANPLVSDPGNVGQSFDTSIDWAYKVDASPRDLVLRAGKAWGGTSVLNGMTYIRGEAAAIDTWEELGNTNWTWQILLPYYILSEDYTRPTPEQIAAGATFQPEFHGHAGPVRVGYTPALRNGSFSAPVMGAWREMGLSHNTDFNKGSLRGFGMGPQTIDVQNKVRWDASRAYYLPLQKRSNVRIVRGTVTRVVWAKERREGQVVAQGVEFVTDGNTAYKLNAKNEVILCAGAIRTPIVLESSGIGNEDVLRGLGIETVMNLPGVGENLIGQPGHQLTYTGTLEAAASAYHSFVDVADLYGASTYEVELGTKQRLSQWAKDIINASPPGGPKHYAVAKLLQVQHDLLLRHKAAAAEILTIVLDGLLLSQFWILQPFSRGSVHLRSTSPDDIDKPVITPRYFSVDFDLTSASQAGRLVNGFWKASSIARHVGKRLSPTKEVLPDNATDTNWAEYLRSTYGASTRSMGTAAMMAQELGGVADSALKVYGTANLRVVDASALPFQTHGHVTATLYAVAERAADIVKGYL